MRFLLFAEPCVVCPSHGYVTFRGMCACNHVYTFISRFLYVCVCVCVAGLLSPGQLSTPEEMSSWPAVPLAASSMVSPVSFPSIVFSLHSPFTPQPPLSFPSRLQLLLHHVLTFIVPFSVPTTLNSPSYSTEQVNATIAWLFFSPLSFLTRHLDSPAPPCQICPDLKLTSWHFHPAVRI